MNEIGFEGRLTLLRVVQGIEWPALVHVGREASFKRTKNCFWNVAKLNDYQTIQTTTLYLRVESQSRSKQIVDSPIQMSRE